MKPATAIPEGMAAEALSENKMTMTRTDSADPQRTEPRVGDDTGTHKDDHGSGKSRKPRFKRIEHKYPVEPRVIQVIKKPKTYMDHTYRDFSQVPPEAGYSHPTKIEDMTFSQKVHHMLSDESLSNWMHWLPHGRAFKIAVPKRLEQSKTLQKYFGHNRYSSFLRQLNNHGFKHLTKGTDRNCYYHECMLRGMPHLTKYMPPGRDARRLIADPENEPDFYQIERLFPLQDKQVSSPLPGVGAQASLTPLLEGLSNLQQIPPGLLAMTAPRPIAPQALNVDGSTIAGGVPGNLINGSNFGQSPQMTSFGTLASPSMGQGLNSLSALQLPQQTQMRDPQLLAALLQQQQQQQQQSFNPNQFAESSLLRFM